MIGIRACYIDGKAIKYSKCATEYCEPADLIAAVERWLKNPAVFVFEVFYEGYSVMVYKKTMECAFRAIAVHNGYGILDNKPIEFEVLCRMLDVYRYVRDMNGSHAATIEEVWKEEGTVDSHDEDAIGYNFYSDTRFKGTAEWSTAWLTKYVGGMCDDVNASASVRIAGSYCILNIVGWFSSYAIWNIVKCFEEEYEKLKNCDSWSDYILKYVYRGG